ncbi:CADD family putative folate metabolism protein [bacterium]|nr:CADD family putative folate metabolism protein [bacterium]
MPATLEATRLIDRIDDLIQAKHLLKHPFYQAWTAGELSLDALRDYAGQYYQHVKAFPTYISALHAHTDDLDVRRHLTENLNDEEGSTPTHPELWLQFAEGLGVSAEAAESTVANSHTQATIRSFRDICANRSVAEGLAALYAYESQIPAVSQSKIDGLKAFYGFTDERTWEYFTEHIVADVEHSAAERAMLECITSNPSDSYHGLQSVGGESADEAQKVLAATSEALDAINGLLTGVAEAHGIEC